MKNGIESTLMKSMTNVTSFGILGRQKMVGIVKQYKPHNNYTMSNALADKCWYYAFIYCNHIYIDMYDTLLRTIKKTIH